MGTVELGEARHAFERGEWDAAFRGWSAADLDALSTTELHEFATAAELVGRHDECVRALQRAFVASEAEGDVLLAVRCAFRLSMNLSAHGEPALAAGWAQRAEGLVADLDEGSPERGWATFLRMYGALGAGDFAAAATCADAVATIGRRHHDSDLTALGTVAQGRMALYAGRVAEGLGRLDEAMVRVIAGETSPIVAGHVYCTAIEGCQEISDFGRVAEWTAALDRWCAAQPGLLEFTGQCAIHRGQVLRLRGQWGPALDEFELATERYRAIGLGDAIGLAAYEVGEVLRLRGEYDAADAAYQRAADHGYDPQPGLALLWLGRGQVAAATAVVDRLLAEPAGPVQRCRLLPSAIDILLARGQVDRARELAAELATVASGFGCVALEAAAARADGAVELAAGDPAGALPYLRKALQLWARLEAPHDQARSRVLLGRAFDAVGDDTSARRELEAARATFRQLGARPAADEVDEMLAPTSLPAGLTAREAEVLRLVATGRSNSQIAADLVLSEKTVARHLSNIFVKLDVGSRTAATAFAFEQGLV